MASVNIEECRVVEMFDGFPFGELKEAGHGDEPVLVRKKLIFHNAGQLDIIKKMVTFLSTLQNEYLVQLRAQ